MRFLISLVCLSLFLGCQSGFFKSIDGTSTQIGLSLPTSDNIQIQAVSYLNGQNVFVKDEANIKYSYSTYQSNSYFGVVKTIQYRTSDIYISPKTNSLNEVSNDGR